MASHSGTWLRRPDIAWWSDGLVLTIDLSWGSGCHTYDFETSQDLDAIAVALRARAIVIADDGVEEALIGTDQVIYSTLTRVLDFVLTEGFFVRPATWISLLNSSMSANPTASSVLLTSTPSGLARGAEVASVRIPLTSDNLTWLPQAATMRRSARLDDICESSDLTDTEVTRLLQSVALAYGFTRIGRKVTPSAGALYPLAAIIALRRGLDVEICEFSDAARAVRVLGSLRTIDVTAALGGVSTPPAAVFLCFAPSLSMWKYGARSLSYALVESGCVSEVLSIVSVGADLACRLFGGFPDDILKPIDPDLVPLISVFIGSAASIAD